MTEIICGNCVDIMSAFPIESVDLTITSPPYDELRSYNGYEFSPDKIIKELFRITKEGGIVVWVVGDAVVNGGESGNSFRQAIQFIDAGFSLYDTMIYQKSGSSFPSKGRYTQIFEYMFVFSKGKPKTFNPICDVPKLWEGSWGKLTNRNKDGELIQRKRHNEGMAKSGRATDGRYGYKQRTNIWTITNGKNFGHSDKDAYLHPATFPEKLARDHILTWSNEGDIVFDPMCGSGTTGVAAKKLNRKFIGIDISKEYCELSEKRISKI